MGNKLILNPQIPQIIQAQWQIVQQKTSENCDYGEFQVLRNKTSRNLIQQYELVFADENDFKIYLQSFVWRLREPKIVRTMYLAQNHKKQLCSITYAAKVYIEHIKIRLSDIRDIPFPENLYIAICMLEGYSKLYQHTSEFQIQQSQVCVDDNGHVKVWINSDLSKNYPLYGEEGLSYSSNEMVDDIIRIVAENTDQQTEPYPFDQYFEQHKKHSINFQDAKILVSQYARQFKTKIPHCFQSILQMYEKDQFETQQQLSFHQQEKSYRNNQLNNSHVYQIKNLKHETTNQREAKSNSVRRIKLQQSMQKLPYSYGQQYSNSKNLIQFSGQNWSHQNKNQSLVAYLPIYKKVPSLPTHQPFEFNRNFHSNQLFIPKQKYPNLNNIRSQYITNPIYVRSEPLCCRYPIRTVQPSAIKVPIVPSYQSNYMYPSYNQYHQYSDSAKHQNYQNTPIKKIIPLFEVNKIQETILKNQQQKQENKIPSFIQSQKIAPLYVKPQDDQSGHMTQSQIIKEQQKIIQCQKQQLRRLQHLKQIERQSHKKESKNTNASYSNVVHKQSIQPRANCKNVQRYKAFYYTVSSQQELDPEIAADLRQIQLSQRIS